MHRLALFLLLILLLPLTTLPTTAVWSQSIDLYSYGDGSRIIDPWPTVNFRACNVSPGTYTPNITAVTNATYAIGFSHPGDPLTSTAVLLWQATYEVPPAVGGYELRGGLGCLPPGTNPTVIANERQYTFSGLLSNCRYQVMFNTQGGVDELV